MRRDWRDYWKELKARLEKLEKLSVGHSEDPVLARTSFDGFFIHSESLRDLVNNKKRVDSEMRAFDSLQLAHDIAITAKHGSQKQPPWSGGVDFHVEQFSFALRSPPSFMRRAQGALVPIPGAPPLGTATPTKWSYRWEVGYTCADSSTTRTLDGLQLARSATADWQQIIDLNGFVL